jgi:glycosyltransferase involved in cell wall biosynthesis
VWLDYVEPITTFWAAVDIATLPACGPESFSRVTIEAMAMGKPVITTRVGGPEEIIESGLSGFLIQPGDSRILIATIEELLNDPEKRENMGRAGRRRVEQLFSADLYAQRMMALCDEIVSNLEERNLGKSIRII